MRRLGWAALFIAGTLLAAFTIAWMLSGRIVRPLRQLGRDASVLAAGELSHRSAVHTRDEVGALAENFNRMAEALEHRQKIAPPPTRCKAKDTLTAVIDASPVAIVCSSRERRVVIWNRGAERMFGYTPEEALGRSFILVPPEGKAESQALFERAFKGETIRDVELKRMRKDGIRIDVRVTAAPMYNLDGTVRNVAWAYEDITDRKKAEEQLRRLAHYDQLTGLPNRLFAAEGAGRLLSRRQPQPAGCPCAVRSRRLQGRERHARPLDRRRAAHRGRPAPDQRRRAPQRGGSGVPAGRRRVRLDRARLRRPTRGRRDRRVDPQAADRASPSTSIAAYRRQRRRRHRAQ